MFTVVYDDRGEVFCGCVSVSEVVYVESVSSVTMLLVKLSQSALL